MLVLYLDIVCFTKKAKGMPEFNPEPGNMREEKKGHQFSRAARYGNIMGIYAYRTSSQKSSKMKQTLFTMFQR